jgi:GTP-binding protein YchF
MAHIGIVGFPNVGKTTLFNALTGLSAVTAAHPFSTTEPNLGVADVPDPCLDEVAGYEGSAKTTHATLELLDLPAMAKPGHGGGLGAQFLGRLREREALCVVLRAFDDPSIPADESGIDPVAQAEELLLELALADAEVLARRHERVAKEAASEPKKRPEAEVLARAVVVLEDGRALRSESWHPEELALFRDAAPLTLKPAIWVINAGEDDAVDPAGEAAIAAIVPDGDVVVTLSAEIEEEGSRLDPDDRAEMYEALGLGEGALTRVVRAAYRALGLISFYTLGPKDARAWAIRRGTKAREAAGKIHTDLERGFIRAEVIPIDDVVAAKGWDAAKADGKMRLEGKDYVVHERDVLLVRFSV